MKYTSLIVAGLMACQESCAQNPGRQEKMDLYLAPKSLSVVSGEW